jgi:hypothetical protein
MSAADWACAADFVPPALLEPPELLELLLELQAARLPASITAATATTAPRRPS